MKRVDEGSGRRMTLQQGGIPEALRPAAEFILALVVKAIPSRVWSLNGAVVLGVTEEGFQHYIGLCWQHTNLL